jgi:hypothetical protein
VDRPFLRVVVRRVIRDDDTVLADVDPDALGRYDLKMLSGSFDWLVRPAATGADSSPTVGRP